MDVNVRESNSPTLGGRGAIREITVSSTPKARRSFGEMILSAARLCFVGVLAAITLLPGRVAAEEASEPRVLILSSFNAGPYRRVVEGFRAVLEKHGFPTPSSASDLDPAHIAPGGKRPSVVLTVGASSTSWILRYVKEVPVVACLLPGKRLAEAPANTTGVRVEFPVDQEFDWLGRFLPDARRVGVLYNPSESGHRVAAAREAAAAKGLELVEFQIETPSQIPGALEKASGAVDVLWGVNDAMVFSPQTAQSILIFAFRARIPLVGFSLDWAKAGALYALERDYRDLGQQCGEMAVEILRGRSPADIPAASPRRIFHGVNLKTARHMGIELDPDLLLEAAAVFPEGARREGR